MKAFYLLTGVLLFSLSSFAGDLQLSCRTSTGENLTVVVPERGPVQTYLDGAEVYARVTPPPGTQSRYGRYSAWIGGTNFVWELDLNSGSRNWRMYQGSLEGPSPLSCESSDTRNPYRY